MWVWAWCEHATLGDSPTQEGRWGFLWSLTQAFLVNEAIERVSWIKKYLIAPKYLIIFCVEIVFFTYQYIICIYYLTTYQRITYSLLTYITLQRKVFITPTHPAPTLNILKEFSKYTQRVFSTLITTNPPKSKGVETWKRYLCECEHDANTRLWALPRLRKAGGGSSDPWRRPFSLTKQLSACLE